MTEIIIQKPETNKEKYTHRNKYATKLVSFLLKTVHTFKINKKTILTCDFDIIVATFKVEEFVFSTFQLQNYCSKNIALYQDTYLSHMIFCFVLLIKHGN